MVFSGAPSGRFSTSKGRLQKDAQAVCSPEERPSAGRGPEPGMQDGGDAEGKGCSEVGTGEGRSGAGPASPAGAWQVTEASLRAAQESTGTVRRRAGPAGSSSLLESDASGGGESAEQG